MACSLLSLVVFPPLLLLVVAAYAYNWRRSAAGLVRDGIPRDKARGLGFLLMLSKLPNMIGFARFHWRRLTGRAMRIIEYK